MFCRQWGFPKNGNYRVKVGLAGKPAKLPMYQQQNWFGVKAFPDDALSPPKGHGTFNAGSGTSVRRS